VIIISDERPATVESLDRTGSRLGDVDTPRVSRYALLDTIPRERWRSMEMGLVDSNQIIHFYGDGNRRSEERGISRDSERRGRTLLINATPSVVPRVAEEEEIDRQVKFVWHQRYCVS